MQVIFARLPRMTDRLGQHWGQPKGLRDRVQIFETHATIDAHDWAQLSNYASSYPSGIYAGKVWRRGPWLVWYGRPRKITEHGREKEVCSIGYEVQFKRFLGRRGDWRVLTPPHAPRGTHELPGALGQFGLTGGELGFGPVDSVSEGEIS